MPKVDILLGGVPFGRNNVGDEAILECVVGIIRDVCPSARITVSTDSETETRNRLGVETTPLFGFAPPYSERELRAAIAAADVFIWPGATGLSDYPEIPLRMLEIARAAGVRTVVWGVGMNDELNPFIYRVLPGRRATLLKLLTRLTFNRLNLIESVERAAERRARDKIVQGLNQCDLVVLRDPETLGAVHDCGEVPAAIIGADSAELLRPEPWDNITLTREAHQVLESGARKIGLCVSAQREIVHRRELIEFLDRLVDEGYAIVFLPMNHFTDAEVMQELRAEMKNQAGSVVIGGRRPPGEILAIAGRLDLVISSRLHLLILASVLHVPIIGISRGSKVDNYLAPFGQVSAGSVEACDFDHMRAELDKLIESRDEFRDISEAVRGMLLQRLDAAKVLLADVLNG